MTAFKQNQAETGGSKTVRPRPRRLWIRLVLYVVIFLSGGVVGVGGALFVIRARVLHAVHHPDEMPKLIAKRLQGVLALDDEQTQKIGVVLQERQSALQEIRSRYQPEVEAELEKVDEQISEILDKDQRAEWRERFQVLRETWVPPIPAS